MSGFGPLVAAFGRALHPLSAALTDPDRLRLLLADLGWECVPGEDDVAGLADLVPVAAIERAVEIVGSAAITDELSAADLLELADLIAEIIDSVAALANLTSDDLTAFAAELADPLLWADVGAVLAERLLVRLLDVEVPGVALALRLTGIITWEVRGYASRLGRWRLDLGRLVDLFADPLAAIREAIGWGPGFSYGQQLPPIRAAWRGLGVPGTLRAMSDPVRDAIVSVGDGDPSSTSQVEIVLADASDPGGGAVRAGIVVASAGTASEPVGVYVGNLAAGQLQAGVTNGIWTLSATGDVEGMATVGAVVRPGATIPVTSLPDGEFSLRLDGTPEQPWRLFGSADGTRIEIGGAEIAVGLAVDGATADTWLSVGATGDGVRVIVDLGGADNFLTEVLGGAVPDISIPAAVRLGSSSGLAVTAGTLGLEFTIPCGRQLGPVYLDDIAVALAASGEQLTLGLGAGLSLTIGPFTATVAGVGAAFALDLGGTGGTGGFAGLDATLAFQPPEMIGFALDTEAASGGGLVWIDAEIGRYSGALSLDILSIGVDAIVVIDTQLPGDPDGWAFFASLSIAFPGIPLGFGFTLNGVGGLLALNRCVDGEALAAGLRAGVVDALLFPDDPVGDSAELISQIDEYFPLRAGSTVIGPVVEIGWGSPTLITGQLGTMISLPDGVIVVLGSLAAELPSPDAPVLSLHMDTLGVIDVPGGTFSVMASLYDSQLLEVIQLSGDMGTFVQLGPQPFFVMSVGGYHPGFVPPSALPASMQDLRPMQASIEIDAALSISVQAYFAVTSNTVQFGASVNITATAEVLLATYTAKGWFTLDVLLTFSPFKLSAGMSAGVGVYAGDRELMGVQLSLLLEGPQPWYAIGTASFRFFGLRVDFALEVGGRAASEPMPLAHPRAAVMAALRSPESWHEIAPTDPVVALVSYAEAEPDDTTVWVRPDHQVGVRQGVAPLDRTLEIVGNATPAAGDERLNLTGSGVTGQAGVVGTPLDDWFAPAQFEKLSGPDRLRRASFELMTAGVTFGTPDAGVSADEALTTSVTTDYEDDEYEPAQPALTEAVRMGAANYALRRTVTAPSAPIFTVAPTTYAVVDTIDGTRAAGSSPNALTLDGSQFSAIQRRARLVGADPSAPARYAVVPAAAVIDEPRRLSSAEAR